MGNENQRATGQVVSREPWPKKGIADYQKISDGEWGYLVQHDDGTFEFDETSTPTDYEIMERWSTHLGKGEDDK